MALSISLRKKWFPAATGSIILSLLLVNGCGSAQESRYLPGDSLDIEVTGADFQWHIRYAGRDGMLNTPDDIQTLQNIHLPVNVVARIKLKSKDYLYSLALPHLGLKQLAVPAMEFPLEFETNALGSYPFLGDQLCGYSHPSLMGELIVQTRQDFEAWMEENQR